MKHIFSLIKFGNKDNLEKLLDKGQLRFGAIIDFQKSNEKGRGDKFEGAVNITNTQFSNIECDHPDLGNFIFLPVKDKLSSIINYTTYPFYSFSTYALSNDNFKNSNFHKIDRKMNEFGNYALIIKKPEIFLNKLRLNLLEKNINFSYQLVEYIDFMQEKTIETNLFSKTIDLQYQFEHRILLSLPREEKEFFIEIGSIKEFCFLSKTDDILKTKFKAIRSE